MGKPLNLTMAPSRPTVSAVIKNSPADVAGIKAGDHILALNDDPIYDPMEIIKRVETNPTTPFSLTIANGPETRVVRLLPSDTGRPEQTDHRNRFCRRTQRASSGTGAEQ